MGQDQRINISNNYENPIFPTQLCSNALRLESRAAAVGILDLGVELAVLHGAGGEGGSGLPAGGGTGSGLLHHLVDLLKGETLGLGNEEVGVDEGACAETAPDEEDRRSEVAFVGVDHVGGDDGDDTKMMLD